MANPPETMTHGGRSSSDEAIGGKPWQTVYTMIMLANPGATTGTITPVIVDAFVAHGRLSVSGAVGLGAAQMAGMGIALALTALLTQRADQRPAAALAVLVACVGNLLSSVTTTFYLLLALRLLVGVATGVCYSIAVVSIASSSNVARNFGYSVSANQIAGILLLTILPALTIWGGLSATLVALTIFTLLCGGTLAWLPAHVASLAEDRVNVVRSMFRPVRSTSAIRGLVAMLLLATAFGACWPIVGRIAAAAHVGKSAIVTGFALAGYGGVVGGLTSAFLGPRLNKNVILVLGSTGFAASLMLQVVPHVSFALAAISLMFFTTFNIPNYLSLVAELDGSGRLAIVMTALMQFGMAAGQAAVASVGNNLSFEAIVTSATAVAFLSCLLVLSVRAVSRP